MLDLIIRNGRVVDEKNRLNAITDLAVKDGKIVSVGSITESAAQEVDASGLLVIPGVIDSHMHASSWLAGPMSFRMLAAAGVTTAMEMAGPLECVKNYLRHDGAGLNIACLEYLRPGENLPDNHPTTDTLDRLITDALARGAFGVKLLAGHYPMTPEAEARLLHRTAERGVWFAVHAGSTEHGSNIEGMREIIELADGTPFHLCHINAYCRGSVRPVEEEIAEATALLESHPEIDTESYLSPVNGCSGKCVNGVPESRVTCNCLKSGGYSVDANGVRSALLAGYAQAQKTENGVVVLADRDESVAIWEAHQSDVPISFHVNPALSRFYFAARKRSKKHFLVDSFCTDGGGIPRNVIIENGLSLVKFGAITLEEFVLKSSWAAARLMGLDTKGHFTPGADADITVVDYAAQQAVHSFVAGRPILFNRKVVGSGGTLITTPSGANAAREAGLGVRTVDMTSVFSYRLQRFHA